MRHQRRWRKINLVNQVNDNPECAIWMNFTIVYRINALNQARREKRTFKQRLENIQMGMFSSHDPYCIIPSSIIKWWDFWCTCHGLCAVYLRSSYNSSIAHMFFLGSMVGQQSKGFTCFVMVILFLTAILVALIYLISNGVSLYDLQ